jgi:hypothetical protein
MTLHSPSSAGVQTPQSVEPPQPVCRPTGEIAHEIARANPKAHAEEGAAHIAGDDRTDQSVIWGWGTFYRKADVRRLFHRLDGWIMRRLYASVAKRWRNTRWRRYCTSRFIREFG